MIQMNNPNKMSDFYPHWCAYSANSLLSGKEIAWQALAFSFRSLHPIDLYGMWKMCVGSIYDGSRWLATRWWFLLRWNDNNPTADAELWSSVRVIDAKGLKQCWHWTGSAIAKMWACSLRVWFKSVGNWKEHVVMSRVLTLWLMNYKKRICFRLRSPTRWINHYYVAWEEFWIKPHAAERPEWHFCLHFRTELHFTHEKS